MKSLPPRAPGLACALLLAATTAAADEAPGTGRIRVEPVSCDSLLLRIDPDSFFALQEDRGEGFRTVQVLEDSGAEIVLRRSAPPPGGTVWFRLHGREPENGLPVYGSERIWTRRPPELNPRLEDDVMHWDPPACPLDRLWVSLYRDVRLSEVLTFPAAEGRAQLPPGDWNRIAVSWAGSAREVRLGDWEDPLPADQLGEMPGVPAGVAGLALPEAPDLPPPPRVLSVHSSGIELELPSGCVPLLLRGEAELRPLGGEQPRYMVAFGPPGELLVASRTNREADPCRFSGKSAIDLSSLGWTVRRPANWSWSSPKDGFPRRPRSCGSAGEEAREAVLSAETRCCCGTCRSNPCGSSCLPGMQARGRRSGPAAWTCAGGRPSSSYSVRPVIR